MRSLRDNYICCSRSLFLLVVNSLVLMFVATGSAQESKPPTVAEVRTLIRRSRDKDVRVMDEAYESLSKLDGRALPAVTEILRTGKTCERLYAAKILLDLDPKSRVSIPVLTGLAKSRTIFSSEDDLMCRRAATFLLALYPEGIPILTEFLKDEDIFVRRSAIFAFDELTETAKYPEGSKDAMMAAIPQIVEASKDKDEVLNRMGEEILGQITRGRDEELSKAAKEAMGQKP
jgi:hypothetical protein